MTPRGCVGDRLACLEVKCDTRIPEMTAQDLERYCDTGSRDVMTQETMSRQEERKDNMK